MFVDSYTHTVIITLMPIYVSFRSLRYNSTEAEWLSQVDDGVVGDRRGSVISCDLGLAGRDLNM